LGREATVKDLVAVLKGSPVFSVLREEQLREVAETARLAEFGRDQMIVQEGEGAAIFYVVLSGLVEVRRTDRPVARLGPGQFFGETALVSGAKRSAGVIALRNTSCMVLSGSELRSYPAVVVKVLEESNRLSPVEAPRADRSVAQKQQAESAAETEIGFESGRTKLVFESLVRSFTEDYMVKRLYLEQAGWRTVGELSRATKIPRATLYGEHGNFGPSMNELMSRGLIETRIFAGQRGRGGEVLRARIAYDKEPVKRYVDRVVMTRK
jgi:CRP-like cAMP-binding protein